MPAQNIICKESHTHRKRLYVNIPQKKNSELSNKVNPLNSLHFETKDHLEGNPRIMDDLYPN